MPGILNITNHKGEIISFDYCTNKGRIKCGAMEFSFSGYCFHGTSCMCSPRVGGKVSFSTSNSSNEVVFVFSDEYGKE
jgi:hypothetical protein